MGWTPATSQPRSFSGWNASSLDKDPNFKWLSCCGSRHLNDDWLTKQTDLVWLALSGLMWSLCSVLRFNSRSDLRRMFGSLGRKAIRWRWPVIQVSRLNWQDSAVHQGLHGQRTSFENKLSFISRVSSRNRNAKLNYPSLKVYVVECA
jgi:hypothetical protein